MAWLRNPAWAREMTTIGRSSRTPLALAMVAGLAGLIAVAAVASWTSPGSGVAGGGLRLAGNLPIRAGAQLLSLMGVVQLAFVVLVTPALAAGTISGERERRTLEVLLRTRVSALALVGAKLGGVVLHVALILTAAAPSVGILFLLGGAPLRRLGLMYGVLLATALLLAAIGVCASAWARHTSAAALAAYGVTGALVLGTLLPGWLAGGAATRWGLPPGVLIWTASGNPVAALAATSGGPTASAILSAALGPLTAADLQAGGAGAVGGGTRALGRGAGSSPPAMASGGLQSFSVGAGAAAPGTVPVDAFTGGWIPPAYAALMSGSSNSTVAGARLFPPLPRVYRAYLAFTAAAAALCVALAVFAVRLPTGAGLRAALGLAPAGRPRPWAFAPGGDALDGMAGAVDVRGDPGDVSHGN